MKNRESPLFFLLVLWLVAVVLVVLMWYALMHTLYH